MREWWGEGLTGLGRDLGRESRMFCHGFMYSRTGCGIGAALRRLPPSLCPGIAPAKALRWMGEIVLYLARRAPTWGRCRAKEGKEAGPQAVRRERLTAHRWTLTCLMALGIRRALSRRLILNHSAPHSPCRDWCAGRGGRMQEWVQDLRWRGEAGRSICWPLSRT